MEDITVINLTLKSRGPSNQVNINGKMFIYCIDCHTYHLSTDSKHETLHHSKKNLITQENIKGLNEPEQTPRRPDKILTLQSENVMSSHRKKLSLTYQPLIFREGYSLDLLQTKKTGQSVSQTERGVTLVSKGPKNEYCLTESPQQKEPSGEIHRIGKSDGRPYNLLQSKIRRLQPRPIENQNNPEVNLRKINVETAKIRKLKTTSEIL